MAYWQFGATALIHTKAPALLFTRAFEPSANVSIGKKKANNVLLLKQFDLVYCLKGFVLCCAQSLSHVPTLLTHGLQSARLLYSWGFSRQEYWSGLPFPSPRDLPDPRVKQRSPALWADSLSSGLPGKPVVIVILICSDST